MKDNDDKEACLKEIAGLRKKVNNLIDDEKITAKQRLTLLCGLVSEFFVLYDVKDEDIKKACDNIYKFTLEGRKIYHEEIEKAKRGKGK